MRKNEAAWRTEPKAPTSKEKRSMPQGDKSSYTDKQKRHAGHIEAGYEKVWSVLFPFQPVFDGNTLPRTLYVAKWNG